jgi:signal transduction histidine kinase
MNTHDPFSLPPALRRIYAWPRVKTGLVIVIIWFGLFLLTWEAPRWVLLARLLWMVFAGLTIFGILEAWPRTLPRWLARWALQVIGVALIAVPVVAIGYTVTTLGLNPPWYKDPSRLEGFGTFAFLSLLIGPWVAVAALFKKIRNEAERQALAFELEKSRLEQQATLSRMSLLQAQVQPHFLFNTLANVRELVDMGSPNAPAVLDSLIAYLKAAVPQINAPLSTIAQELNLARSYLDVMQMRMPDRLQFSVSVEADTTTLQCPPLTILTLVENSMRHGIDPTEDGGRIDISVRTIGSRCCIEVIDTGCGLTGASSGLGTGLDNLRERLALAFGGQAQLQIRPHSPRGTEAEISFPTTAANTTSSPQANV